MKFQKKRYQFLRFPGGKEKTVTFSYDDGCPQDLRFAQVMDSYNMKCTFNFNGNEMRAERALRTEDVQAYILDKGHEIAVHGQFHRPEGTLRPIEGIREVLDNRLELERRYGIIVRGMAYPGTGVRRFSNGANYEMVKQYLTELDIAYARSLNGDNDEFNMPRDWHNWVPTAHHNNPNILAYADAFTALDIKNGKTLSLRYPRLFLVWGHTREFDQKDNWDHLDALCQKLANREDTWYATNLEICEYVKAYESLIYSADGTLVYNPTVQTVWMDVDGDLYAVEPGKTIKL